MRCLSSVWARWPSFDCVLSLLRQLYYQRCQGPLFRHPTSNIVSIDQHSGPSQPLICLAAAAARFAVALFSSRSPPIFDTWRVRLFSLGWFWPLRPFASLTLTCTSPSPLSTFRFATRLGHFIPLIMKVLSPAIAVSSCFYRTQCRPLSTLVHTPYWTGHVSCSLRNFWRPAQILTRWSSVQMTVKWIVMCYLEASDWTGRRHQHSSPFLSSSLARPSLFNSYCHHHGFSYYRAIWIELHYFRQHFAIAICSNNLIIGEMTKVTCPLSWSNQDPSLDNGSQSCWKSTFSGSRPRAKTSYRLLGREPSCKRKWSTRIALLRYVRTGKTSDLWSVGQKSASIHMKHYYY